MKNVKHIALAASVSILLAACGGGGGGSTSAPAPSAPPTGNVPSTPTVTPADIQTSVAPLTYSAASDEFAFVTAFNQLRQQVGLGLLAQNALLDKSAQNHLQYVVTNWDVNGGTVNMATNDPITGRSMFHIEQADKPGFTGVQESDRARVAGYNGIYVGEEGSFGGGKGGKVAFDSLSRTIYHRAGLMAEAVRDVGIAVGKDASQTMISKSATRKPNPMRATSSACTRRTANPVLVASLVSRLRIRSRICQPATMTSRPRLGTR